MPEQVLTRKIKGLTENFIDNLINIYGDVLISVVIYGSAASGEFSDKCSNINLLVVLKDTGLKTLAKAASLVNKYRFRNIQPVFLSQEYISNSCDVFPIEFIDMQENHLTLYGNDVLKGIAIDLKNLRFQCEQELKGRIMNLKRLFVKKYRDKIALKNALVKLFISIAHILRNIIRLKGKQPVYLKQGLIIQISKEFPINLSVWEKILSVRNNQLLLDKAEIPCLFESFVEDLEKISAGLNKYNLP